MNKKDIIGYIIGFVVCFIFMAALMFLTFKPIINSLNECEEREWDGSEYNTGITDIKLFEDSEEIIVKCNKDPNGETDAMIGIKDAILGERE